MAGVLYQPLLNETREEKIALAWAARNCLESGIQVPEFAGLVPCMNEDAEDSGHSQVDAFWATVKILMDVFCDDQSDPISGATRFHRHDSCPKWADKKEPCALIGSYFFYHLH